MGLTIYYSGSFNRESSLSEMIEEVKDIAEIYNWPYHIFEKEFSRDLLGKRKFNDEVYGILFSPPKCETVVLCFFSNGRMCNPFMFDHWIQSGKEKFEKYLFDNFTKTQYAGAEVHKIIIDLFRHLSKKYFTKFSMIDEGKYWESNDEKLLQKTFKKWGELIDGFADTLANIEKQKGESIEDTIIRAAKSTHRLRKK